LNKNVISANLRSSASSASSAFSFRVSLGLAILAGGCLLLSACVALPGEPITYAVMPGKPDAQVSYQAEGGNVTVEIRSQSGIGSAQLSQTGGGAPTSVTMRLHLKGLEQFTFQYPGATVTAAVSSHDGAISETVSVKGGAAQSIGPDSVYWMPVKISATDTSIPLKDGYFEVQAPKDFLGAASREFTMKWVDFYR
jgi:hypothetical protein